MDRGSFLLIRILISLNKILDKDSSCSGLISFGKVWHKPVENLTTEYFIGTVALG